MSETSTYQDRRISIETKLDGTVCCACHCQSLIFEKSLDPEAADNSRGVSVICIQMNANFFNAYFSKFLYFKVKYKFFAYLSEEIRLPYRLKTKRSEMIKK